jgi:hypothetical protein
VSPESDENLLLRPGIRTTGDPSSLREPSRLSDPGGIGVEVGDHRGLGREVTDEDSVDDLLGWAELRLRSGCGALEGGNCVCGR